MLLIALENVLEVCTLSGITPLIIGRSGGPGEVTRVVRRREILYSKSRCIVATKYNAIFKQSVHLYG